MILINSISFFYPIIVAFILLIISSVPFYIAGISAFFPALDIMVIFYWSIQRPSALPNSFVFLLGVFRDVIEGVTLGVSPCIYLITKLLVTSSRGLYKKVNFLVILQGFAIVMLLTIAAKWLLVSVMMGATIAVDSAIMQFMLSIAVYPAVHWLFNLVSSIMPEKFHDE